MKKTAWIAALVLFWLALVIRNVPAQWGLWLVGAPLQMEGISGTIWSGSATNAVLPFQQQSYSLGKLEWQLDPWSLLTLSPCLQIDSEFQSQTLTAQACTSTEGEAQFSNVVVSLPAEVAQLWLPVMLKGELLFRIDNLTVHNGQVANLSGKGRWSDAYYHNSFDWVKLGELGFDFKENESGGVRTQVVDIDSPLKLDLLYEFSMQGSYTLVGDVIVQPNAPQELAQVLMAIADQKGNNHFRIEWAGS